MKKKMLITVLVLCMLITGISCVLGNHAQADSFSYRVNDDGHTIDWTFTCVKGDENTYAENVYIEKIDSSYEVTENLTIHVPDKMQDSKGVWHKVASIGGAGAQMDSFFFKGVEDEIIRGAVKVDASGCHSLKKVNPYVANERTEVIDIKFILPNTVEDISELAFINTSKVLEVYVPNINVCFSGEQGENEHNAVFHSSKTSAAEDKYREEQFSNTNEKLTSYPDAKKYYLDANADVTDPVTLNAIGLRKDHVYLYQSYEDFSEDDNAIYTDTSALYEEALLQREHYTFMGYGTTKALYDDEDTENIMVFNNKGRIIPENIKNLNTEENEKDQTHNYLYAKWKPDTYKIRYQGNEGNCSIPVQSVTYNPDQIVTLSNTIPVRTGYTFMGWNTEADGNGTMYDSGSSIDMVQKDIILYAQWRENYYTISFDSNTGQDTMADISLNYTEERKMPECAFEKVGYTFNGWNTKANGSGKFYATDKVLSKETTADGEVITLYAQWRANAYTVKFDANGGEGTEVTQKFTYGVTQNLAENQYAKEGYTFEGWSNTKDGMLLYPEPTVSIVKPLSAVDGDVVTLYAVWKANTYDITYHFGETVFSVQATYDDAVTLLNENTLLNDKGILSVKGYTLLGYSKTKEQRIKADITRDNADAYVKYKVGETIKNLSAKAEVHLYPVYYQNTYTITYDIGTEDETVSSSENYKKSYTVDDTYLFPTPARTGYTFDKWVDKDGNKVEKLTGTGDLALTAVWKENTYTLKYDSNGAEEEPANKKYDIKYTKSVIVPINTNGDYKKYGYKFLGWSYEPHTYKATVTKEEAMHSVDIPGGSMVSKLSAVDKDTVTLYAVWYQETYTITYDLGDKENVGFSAKGRESYTYGTEYTFPTLTCKGYLFKGWEVDNTVCTGIVSSDIGNVTAKATWAPDSYTVIYDTNGGEGAIENKKVNYNGKFKLSDGKNIHKDGCVLLGYSTEKLETVSYSSNVLPQYIIGAEVSNLAYEGEVLLYAVWKEAVYIISYDEGIEGAVPSKDYITQFVYGQKYKFPTLSKSGQTFMGWFDEDGNKVTEINGCSDMKVKAKWKVNKYTVAVTGQGITSSRINDQKISQMDYASEIKSFSATVQEGFVITGVQLVQDNSKELLAKKKFDNVTKAEFELNVLVPQSDVTFEVFTMPNTYPITYDTLGGTISATSYATSYAYGETTKLPQKVTNDGMEFKGWQLEGAGDFVTEISDSDYGSKHYVACYEFARYKATLDLNGGNIDGKTENQVLEYSYKSGDINLPDNITKEGCTFHGWYDTVQKSIITKVDTSLSYNQNILALWQSNASTTSTADLVEPTESVAVELAAAPMEATTGMFYYQLLSDEEKLLYTTIYNYYEFNAENVLCKVNPIEITMTKAYQLKNLYNAESAFCKDHPETFYIRSFAPSTIKENHGSYTFHYTPQTAYTSIVYKADAIEYKGNLNTIVSGLGDMTGNSADEKIKAIYDYLLVHYDYTNNSTILNAETTNETRSIGYMLSHSKGCCESYAKLFKVLCDHYQIPCVTVTSSNHMWNEVQVDNKWYLLDVTFEKGQLNYNTQTLNDSTIHYNWFLLGGTTDADHAVVNATYSDKNGEFVTEYGCFKAPELCGTNFTKNVVANGNVVTEGDITYRLTSDTTAAVHTVNAGAVKVTIPNEINHLGKNYTVTSVGANAFTKCNNLTTVALCDTITTISQNAFKGCKKLKKVTMSKSIQSIGKSAFYQTGITSINLYKANKIDASAFAKCKKLKKITSTAKKLSVGKNAFQQIHKKAVFKVKCDKKKFKKMRKKIGMVKTQKIK